MIRKIGIVLYRCFWRVLISGLCVVMHVFCVYILRLLSGFFWDKVWLFLMKTGRQPCLLLCSTAIRWDLRAAWCFCSCELPCRSVECAFLHCFRGQPYIFAVVNCPWCRNTECVVVSCFNGWPDIFAFMNCFVLALSAVFCSGLLTWERW